MADQAITRYATVGLLAGAYLRADRRGAFLTHTAAFNEAGLPLFALCGRVKPEHLNEDPYAPSYSTTEPPTCTGCRRVLRRRG